MKQIKSKKRVKKDPNAPKKALSAYMLWLNATRDEIKKDNPGITVTELSKKAGVLWKALDDKTVISNVKVFHRNNVYLPSGMFTIAKLRPSVSQYRKRVQRIDFAKKA